MPLVAHTDLPSYQRLKSELYNVLSLERARHQDIRELHIGLLNMMPDAALAATERQFMRLIDVANQIAQFYIHIFTLPQIPRSAQGRAYVERYYESFDTLRHEGLDALIITGANVSQPDLSREPFWEPLCEVVDWAMENVTSTLCACLATHAIVKHLYGIERRRLPAKCWGVFQHRLMERGHPLVRHINTRFDVPHSRYNEVYREQLEAVGVVTLVESGQAGVHMAVSPDQLRVVYMQGHQEYDAVSLFKEYQRELRRFFSGEREDYPPYPDHYFSDEIQAYLAQYARAVRDAKTRGGELPEINEGWITDRLNNTWGDTAKAVFNNWLGLVYQVTNQDRRLPFMEGVDPQRPLAILDQL